MNFKSYINYVKKWDTSITISDFVILNLLLSDFLTEEELEQIFFYNMDIGADEWYCMMSDKEIFKITGERYRDISLREKGRELIGVSEIDAIIELAKQVRELFPGGVKSGGYLVRSSLVDIADKLRKFFKKHKYTADQVLQATERYVSRKRKDNWKFMQIAAYFIEKNNISSLAAECENLLVTNKTEEADEVNTMKTTRML